MKKIFYLIFIALLFVSNTGNAQFYITGYTVTNDPVVSVTTCPKTYFQIHTSSFGWGMWVKAYHDGIVDSTSIGAGTGFSGVANFMFNILTPGNYTYKMVMSDSLGVSAADSIIINLTKLHCGFSASGLYHDVSSNCLFDAPDNPIYNPATVEVSIAGIPIDTISCYNNINFMNNSTSGTVYTYRLLQAPVGFVLSCPTSGVIYDTVGMYNVPKQFGFVCSTASSFDLKNFVRISCGTHTVRSQIIIKNNYCNPVNADYRILMSPKYNFLVCTPSPTSISGGAPSLYFPAMSANDQKYITAFFETPSGTGFPPGDTINSRHELTPLIGDIDPSNNIIIRVDTVRTGWDPNDISVYPPRNIFAGTELEYTVRFENTGNDTAFNIHILDTLSNNVNFNTLKVAAASHNMNVTQYTSGINNIVKFDFPNINLLDSSHHGECSGMVVFTVNAKTGLPYGTQIFNRAGIYFDYNPVVLTNTVENIIPYPDDVTTTKTTQGTYIYPNPVSDILYIKTVKANQTTATITNTIGQIMATYQLNAADSHVNVKALPTGIYFISLRGEKGVDVQKFEKQ